MSSRVEESRATWPRLVSKGANKMKDLAYLVVPRAEGLWGLISSQASSCREQSL